MKYNFAMQGVHYGIFKLGLAAADVNRDGRVDLFIPRGDFLPPMLLLGRGDGAATGLVRFRTGR